MNPPPPSAGSPADNARVATYRIQLRSGVTLDDVRTRWLRPLVDLGVSHVYLSPVFRASAGSTHGYDIVDPDVVDEALGGEDAFVAMAEAAAELGLGVMIDLVPNHMATDHDRNRRWWDLLRNGPAAAATSWFDLDWDTPERRLRGRMLLPLLPDHYGRELERGAFRLGIEERFDALEPVLVHASTTTPIEMSILAPLLRAAGTPALIELAAEAERLPRWALPHDLDALAQRRRDEPTLRAQLGTALTDPANHRHLADVLTALTSDIEALDALIEAQPYRLARWQTSRDDLTYRRFFDINSLIGVRVDRVEVFEQSHTATQRWVDAGLVDALRIDHVDGLRDPAGYLERLRAMAPDAWIVAEKILEGDELLPPWPIAGTTGYEAGELIGRLELDDEGRPELERRAADAGAEVDVADVVLRAKQDVLDELLAADVNRLTEALLGVCEQRRRVRDVTRRELQQTLGAILTRLPVYRTYARPDHPTRDVDRQIIADVLDAVADDLPDNDPEILSLLSSLLVGDEVDGADEWDFVSRFQQLAAPTMAKGAEDTAWYRLVTLTSRCEVGADPDAWGLPLDRFHESMTDRQAHWPSALTATSTHDSKRSEDVRVRLALLSQDAAAWSELVEEWTEETAASSPGPVSSYRLLQTAVGAWPISAERLIEHMMKAEREAKERTSWLRPDDEFEAALAEHVRAAFTPGPALDLVERWAADHDAAWHVGLLSQKLLALTVPGVPDLYQGSEDALVRLTDPDNRHPVEPPTGPDEDGPKRALVRAALRCRRDHAEAFGPTGTYTPLWASGPRSDHAVAFVRGPVDTAGDAAVVVVAPRRVLALADGGWRGTTITLPDGGWNNVLGDDRAWEGTVDLDELLAATPVALLVRQA